MTGQGRFNKISLSYGLASFKEHGGVSPRNRSGWNHGKYLFRRTRARNSKYDYPGVANRILELERSGRSIFAYYIRCQRVVDPFVLRLSRHTARSIPAALKSTLRFRDLRVPRCAADQHSAKERTAIRDRVRMHNEPLIAESSIKSDAHGTHVIIGIYRRGGDTRS